MTGTSAWMPIYVGDYLRDTGHLDVIEHGAYLLLILHYWTTGPLPLDDRKLAKICRATTRQWRTIKPTILEFFEEDDGVLRHSRIDEERKRAADVSSRRRAAGQAGAAARWHSDGNGNRIANAPQSDRQSQSQSQSQRKNSKKAEGAVRPAPAKKGTRWPEGKEVPSDWRQWAVDELNMSRRDAVRAASAFEDHWPGVSGQRGLKITWRGTWRNWCRNEVKWNGHGKTKQTGDFSNPYAAALAEGGEPAEDKQAEPRRIEGGSAGRPAGDG